MFLPPDMLRFWYPEPEHFYHKWWKARLYLLWRRLRRKLPHIENTHWIFERQLIKWMGTRIAQDIEALIINGAN